MIDAKSHCSAKAPSVQRRVANRDVGTSCYDRHILRGLAWPLAP